MGAFHQRVFGMTTTVVLAEFFYTEWIAINEYLNKKVPPTGKHWVNDEIVPALLVYQLVHAERERGRSPNLWLYLFGHFHGAWYFTWYAIEMQYLQLKTKASHMCFCLQTSSCCLKLSFIWTLWSYMYSIEVGLRWVTFSAEYVGQLISYYYISGKREHI